MPPDTGPDPRLEAEVPADTPAVHLGGVRYELLQFHSTRSPSTCSTGTGSRRATLRPPRAGRADARRRPVPHRRRTRRHAAGHGAAHAPRGGQEGHRSTTTTGPLTAHKDPCLDKGGTRRCVPVHVAVRLPGSGSSAPRYSATGCRGPRWPTGTAGNAARSLADATNGRGPPQVVFCTIRRCRGHIRPICLRADGHVGPELPTLPLGSMTARSQTGHGTPHPPDPDRTSSRSRRSGGKSWLGIAPPGAGARTRART